MATTLVKSYEVEAYYTFALSAFVLYDYENREAIASLEYDGRTVKRTFKSKEGLEYAALEKAAYYVADNAITAKNEHNFYAIMEDLAHYVADKVDAYLYAC